jgi:hypothetical protein
MRRAIAGWFFAVTGFLACPCHLVVTLPLAIGLLGGTALGGTALGGWIAAHQGAIALAAGVYFAGALALAAVLLARTGQLSPHDASGAWRAIPLDSSRQ